MFAAAKKPEHSVRTDEGSKLSPGERRREGGSGDKGPRGVGAKGCAKEGLHGGGRAELGKGEGKKEVRARVSFSAFKYLDIALYSSSMLHDFRVPASLSSLSSRGTYIRNL